MPCQVGITDDVPLYLLGGTIFTLGEGGMTTDAARNSSLTFLVALPSSSPGPAASLCGPGCPKSQNGSLSACGHMYLDVGEELEVGGALDNYISMTAEVNLVRRRPSAVCACVVTYSV